MKIFVLTPYIYAPEMKAHRKNKTGFGMMVTDIIRSVAEKDNTVFVLSHALTKGAQSGSICFLRHSLLQVLRFATIDSLRIFKTAGGSIKGRLRDTFLDMNLGFIRHTISQINPDIVHIHGIGWETKIIVEICAEMNVPALVTAHGLMEHDPSASETEKSVERDFFHFGETHQIPITVISSGIKSSLVQPYYGLQNISNVSVVPNGVNSKPIPPKEDIRKMFGIPGSTKICITVGSVWKGKNQIQLVRAVSLLPKQILKDFKVFILGTIDPGYPIQEEILRLNLSEQIVCCGFVERKQLGSYYAAADLNIFSSRNDGFGLPMIEGFVYGIPCVAFDDLEAIHDIYSPDAMLLCKSRSDQALADAIIVALTKDWDRSTIYKHAQNFSLEHMSIQYLNVYKQTIAMKKQLIR